MLVHNATENILEGERVNRTPPGKEGDANASGASEGTSQIPKSSISTSISLSLQYCSIVFTSVMDIFISAAPASTVPAVPFFTAVNSIPARSQ